MINLIKLILSLQGEEIKNFLGRKNFSLRSLAGMKLSGQKSAEVCQRIISILKFFNKESRAISEDQEKIVLEKNLVWRIFKNLNGFFFFRDLHENDKGYWETNISLSEPVKTMIEIVKPRNTWQTTKEILFFTVVGTVILSIITVFFSGVILGDFTLTLKILQWYSIGPVAIGCLVAFSKLRKLVIHKKKGQKFLEKLLHNPWWLFHKQVSSGDEYSQRVKLHLEHLGINNNLEKMLETAFKVAYEKDGKIGWLWNWGQTTKHFWSYSHTFLPENKEIYITIKSLDEIVLFVELKESFIFFKPSKYTEDQHQVGNEQKIKNLFIELKENIFIPN